MLRIAATGALPKLAVVRIGRPIAKENRSMTVQFLRSVAKVILPFRNCQGDTEWCAPASIACNSCYMGYGGKRAGMRGNQFQSGRH
jgi:hypothetical protein